MSFQKIDTPEQETKERLLNELHLIGVLLEDDQNAISQIEDCYYKLQAKHFSNDATRYVFDVMRSVYQSGRTATIPEINALCGNMFDGIDEILKKAKGEAFLYRDAGTLQTFTDAILRAYTNDKIKSLAESDTPLNETYSRLDELVNDYQQTAGGMNENKANILEYLNADYQNEFSKQVNGKEISTGFEKLDCKLGSQDGKKGLFPERLYVLGAIPSLGKTTFIHQMADNIARAGTPVLFFSLEQSKMELVSKSLIREQYKAKQSDKSRNAYSLNVLLKEGLKPDTLKAMETYKEAAKNLYIFEGNFSTNIDTIRATVRRFKRVHRQTPVIIIDYLQILKPSENCKAKENKTMIDSVVNGLKVMAREEKAPVIAISSFNRGSYTKTAAFDAFKESGAIEYSADTAFSLQLDIADNSTPEQIDNAKAEPIRKIKLICLKNRGGQSTFTAYFNYRPKFEHFEECEKDHGDK